MQHFVSMESSQCPLECFWTCCSTSCNDISLIHWNLTRFNSKRVILEGENCLPKQFTMTPCHVSSSMLIHPNFSRYEIAFEIIYDRNQFHTHAALPHRASQPGRCRALLGMGLPIQAEWDRHPKPTRSAPTQPVGFGCMSHLPWMGGPIPRRAPHWPWWLVWCG